MKPKRCGIIPHSNNYIPHKSHKMMKCKNAIFPSRWISIIIMLIISSININNNNFDILSPILICILGTRQGPPGISLLSINFISCISFNNNKNLHLNDMDNFGHFLAVMKYGEKNYISCFNKYCFFLSRYWYRYEYI